MSRRIPDTGVGPRGVKPPESTLTYRYRGSGKKYVALADSGPPRREHLPVDYIPYDRREEYDNKGRGGVGYG